MKRWAARILVFLLLGAIVNVAVAWGCCWWGNPRFIEARGVSREEDFRFMRDHFDVRWRMLETTVVLESAGFTETFDVRWRANYGSK